MVKVIIISKCQWRTAKAFVILLRCLGESSLLFLGVSGVLLNTGALTTTFVYLFLSTSGKMMNLKLQVVLKLSFLDFPREYQVVAPGLLHRGDFPRTFLVPAAPSGTEVFYAWDVLGEKGSWMKPRHWPRG